MIELLASSIQVVIASVAVWLIIRLVKDWDDFKKEVKKDIERVALKIENISGSLNSHETEINKAATEMKMTVTQAKVNQLEALKHFKAQLSELTKDSRETAIASIDARTKVDLFNVHLDVMGKKVEDVNEILKKYLQIMSAFNQRVAAQDIQIRSVIEKVNDYMIFVKTKK